MGKSKDSKQLDKDLASERNTVNTDYGNFLGTVNSNLNNSQAVANDQRDFASQGYKDIYNRGGLDPTVTENLRKLQRKNSTVYDPVTGQQVSSGDSGDSGGSSGLPSAPSDPFATSRSAFQNFINSGGVDIGAMKEALGGYRTLAESGGYSDADKATIREASGRAAEIGKTGGYDQPTLDRVNKNIGTLENIGQTGGFSPEALRLINSDIAGLRNIGQTGGIDSTGIARIRGNGVFDEFAKTGGYSDADIQNYRARALSPISAQYSNDLNEIQRSNALQGSAAPNYAASIARLSRNRGLNLADTVRNAETDIQSQIRAGKMSGANALSGAEVSLQDMLSRNKLQGLESAATGQGNLENAITQNKLSGAGQAATQIQSLTNAINEAKLAGDSQSVGMLTSMLNSISGNQLTALGGITDTQQGAESIAQQGKIAGAQGMFGVEQADLQAAMQREAQAAAERAASAQTSAYSDAQRAEDEKWWAGYNQNNEMFIGDKGLTGQLGALGGLNELRGTAPAEVGQNYNAALAAMGARNNATLPTLQMQQQNIGPSAFDRVMQVAGMAAPLVGMFGDRPKAPSSPTIPQGYKLAGPQPLASRPVQGWNMYGGR